MLRLDIALLSCLVVCSADASNRFNFSNVNDIRSGDNYIGWLTAGALRRARHRSLNHDLLLRWKPRSRLYLDRECYVRQLLGVASFHFSARQ
ncbi:hypothetical protein BD410DRAFT_460472 [Rickenella mellea]|uniref:Uncharacterized protein n=1 Tax=Rickenella mellea TaxID=50990 RepID=A0A4Y7PWA7_9AGAM|nr:hypothetical protein BD410DRAFT_460472 [Rickenella mellea]